MLFEKPSQRLIVAADVAVDPDDPTGVVEQAKQYLITLCDELAPLGVTIKVNTIARILGATAVEFIQERELQCFLDLKLFDIGNTLENDSAWIAAYNPMILTVAARVKPAAFDTVVRNLPHTLVLPVDPLTDLDDDDFHHFNYTGREKAVMEFFDRIWEKRRPGTICAPKDIAFAPEGFRKQAIFVTPAVKPAWSLEDDNTANALTPKKAIEAGAAAIVVGRGITAATDRLDATKRTLDELLEAMA